MNEHEVGARLLGGFLAAVAVMFAGHWAPYHHAIARWPLALHLSKFAVAFAAISVGALVTIGSSAIGILPVSAGGIIGALAAWRIDIAVVRRNKRAAQEIIREAKEHV